MTKTEVYWVIGEDTDCGKTTIATALIRELNRLGISSMGFKPISGILFTEKHDLLNDEFPLSKCGIFGNDALKLCDASPLSTREMLDIVNPSLLLCHDSYDEPLLIRVGSRQCKNIEYFKFNSLDDFLKDSHHEHIFKKAQLPSDVLKLSTRNIKSQYGFVKAYKATAANTSSTENQNSMGG